MRLVVTRTVDLPADQAWSALTDWERQSDWMPATTVRALGPDAAQGVGGRIEAWTGVGRVGFLDTMMITSWAPPHRCDVMHTGRVLRGPGAFVVTPTGASRCTVTWEEDLEVPFGPVGRAMSVVLAPLARLGLRIALARFSRYARRNRPDGR